MSSDDIIYYNLDIIDAKTVDDDIDPPAKYSEVRDQPILKSINEYLFSITRFTMNGTGKGQTIPIFLPTIDTNILSNPAPQNVNQTVYRVSLQADIGGTIYFAQEPMIHVPQNLDIQQPFSFANGKQDVGNKYYFIYTYDHVVDMFNTAITNAYNSIQAQASPTPVVTKCPFMRYNSDNGKFEIYFDHAGFGENPTGAETWNMYFNSNMYGIFSNYPNKYHGGDVGVAITAPRTNCAYEILPKWEMGLHDISLAGYTYFMNTQEYISTDSLWSPISSIVFSSVLIPVVNENVGQPVTYGEGNSTNTVTTQSLRQPIITDIALTNQYAHDYKMFIAYYPSAEYRLTNLIGSQDLRAIDIQVYWKNRLDNQLYPVNLFNLSSISVKIMFIKKSFYEKKDT